LEEFDMRFESFSAVLVLGVPCGPLGISSTGSREP
jgi:hypothetical protein